MSKPRSIHLTVTALIAVILVQVFVLFLRSWLRIEFQQRGFADAYARDLAYLVVPPLLFALLCPVLREQRAALLDFLHPRHLSLRLILSAIAVGVLMRIVWWSQLVARVAFGVVGNSDPAAGISGPAFAFACPPPPVMGLGIAAMAILVPVVEETVHRGLLQSAFVHRGRVIAILLSALVFTLFHTPSGYVFVMGIVLGLQFWNTGALWAGMITHATYNGLIQIDWRCLRGNWNPAPEQLPLWLPGLAAIAVLIAASIAVVHLIVVRGAGARKRPGRDDQSNAFATRSMT